MTNDSQNRLQLNDGHQMPLIGYGTSGISDNEAAELVFQAIMHGYRLFDTASWYKNEVGVGQGIQRAIDEGVAREEIFVVSKLWPDEMGYDETKEAFNRSFDRLGLTYIDLYLIHWPNEEAAKNVDTWRAMEELRETGRVKSIGVSNFNQDHLKQLFESSDVKPAANQIPIYPSEPNAELTAFCLEHGIRPIGYSPLGKGDVHQNETLLEIGEKYGKTPAQIALKWSITTGAVPIPKTSHEGRMKENLDIFDFELTSEDMARIKENN